MVLLIMWLFFALTTPIFWAVVHVMDSHCVEEVFEEPWMGMITGALTSMVIVVFIPLIMPYFADGKVINSEYLLLAMLAGALIQFSQLFYFTALSHSEAGIVAAYWNLTPALLPIVSFVLFRNVLSLNQYAGITLLVIVSILFCLIDINFKARWNTFVLMLFASILQVAALLIESRVFDHIPYLPGFFFITIGLILAGASPLLLPNVQKVFAKNIKRLYASIHILFGIEIMNLCALASSQKAISIGNPSLVAAVETSVPGYTFVLSVLLIGILPKFGDVDALHRFGGKMLLVVLMILAVWMLS